MGVPQPLHPKDTHIRFHLIIQKKKHTIGIQRSTRNEATNLSTGRYTYNTDEVGDKEQGHVP